MLLLRSFGRPPTVFYRIAETIELVERREYIRGHANARVLGMFGNMCNDANLIEVHFGATICGCFICTPRAAA